MSEDRIEGAARQGLGKVQDVAGKVFGDNSTQLKGKFNDAAGTAQNAYGQIKDQAQDAFSQVQDQAQDVYEELESFVRDQPLVAAAVLAGVGLVVGLLLRGGRKVVYVRK